MSESTSGFKPLPHQQTYLDLLHKIQSEGRGVRIPILTGKTPTFEEIQAHFDAHPELWDKNHPEYGKQPRIVDYISLLPTRPSENKSGFAVEQLKELAKKYPIIVPFEKK